MGSFYVMARMRFDKNTVLEQASNIFWRLGYNATSMQIMCDETALKPGSIYLAFGNKEGLFKESLDYYTEQSLAKLESMLSNASSVEQGVREMLMEFVEEVDQRHYCSCFLIKSQLELSGQPELQRYISERLHKIEALYVRFLMAEYSKNDAKAKATSIMLHVFGIRVYGYHIDSKEQIINGLHLGLPWLSWKDLQ